MLQCVALKIHNVCTSHLLGWTTNTLFLHGFRMEPHLHRSEQCIPADLQVQLPLRWQVDLQAHFVVGTHSGLLPCYTTDISFTAFICNSPCGKPCHFPSYFTAAELLHEICNCHDVLCRILT